MANLKLYSCWMSSCSFRVRIALNLKGLKYEYVPVDLLKGEQRSPELLNVNPIGFVPVLVDGDFVLADSLAIILYLDEKYPQRPLLPSDLRRKAINLQVANTISSGIQPLWNLGVMDNIKQKVGQEEIVPWVQNHIRKGFAALEELLKDHAGRYATGDEVFLADLFLAPQLHSTIKILNLDITEFPLLSRLNEAYSQLPAFQDALPEKQPDAPSSSTA